MVKKWGLLAGFLFAVCAVYAGDVAQFVDLGFSRDGSMYMFAQYGVVDKTYQGYAEIYTVNVAKNDFVTGGVFKTAPSAATAGKSGISLYESLFAGARQFMKNGGFPDASNTQALYLANGAGPAQQVEFRDFEHSDPNGQVTYSVQLVPHLEGNGAKAVSSFYLRVEKKDAAGTVVTRKTVGNPQIRRTGVTGYRIQSIFTDAAGKHLVFVIEKHIPAVSGISIRYMVETLVL